MTVYYSIAEPLQDYEKLVLEYDNIVRNARRSRNAITTEKRQELIEFANSILSRLDQVIDNKIKIKGTKKESNFIVFPDLTDGKLNEMVLQVKEILHNLNMIPRKQRTDM